MRIILYLDSTRDHARVQCIFLAREMPSVTFGDIPTSGAGAVRILKAVRHAREWRDQVGTNNCRSRSTRWPSYRPGAAQRHMPSPSSEAHVRAFLRERECRVVLKM